MEISARRRRTRVRQALDSFFNVVGDAWHRVTTRSPEPTRPMPARERHGYRAHRLPTPMWAPVTAPVAMALSTVLERYRRDHAGVANLRVLQQTLSRPGGQFDHVPDGVLRMALAELRWIASRSRATPGLARLVDQLQRQALDREIQSYTRAIQSLERNHLGSETPPRGELSASRSRG